MQRLARWLSYGGIAVAVIGLSKVHARYIADPPYSYHGSSRFAWSIAYMLLLGIASYGAGLPDLARTSRQAFAVATAAALGAATGMSLVQLATGDALLPRFVVGGAAVVLVPWWCVCSALARGGQARAVDRDRVLVVDEPGGVEALRLELDRAPERHAQIVTELTPLIAANIAPRARPVVEAAVECGANVVVLSRDAQALEPVVVQAASLHEAGVRVRTLSLFYEQWLGKIPVSELERMGLMFDVGELHRARYGRAKRLFDAVLAMFGVAALVIVTPLVLIGNLIANRGPLLFRQERVGRGGGVFRIVKFRTMRPSGGELPNEWTTDNDPRVTPFGRLLRRTHLDELPQMWNVLRGDLSIVGPRPEQPRYVAELVQKLPFYDLRHLVRPGLTGWAQVKYGYAGNESDALEKLQYEFFYLRHQSLAFDLRIVGRTLRSILRGGGR